MKKWALRISVVFLVLFLLLWSVVAVGGVYFTVRPRLAEFDDPERLADHVVVPVSLATEDNITISAWHIPAHPERAVILLSGIDGNRTSSRRHGEWYLEQGYSVLLPDLRASGRSEGSMVTLGWQERKDLVACFNHMKAAGYTHIGVHGHSLGAATICFALPEMPDVAFIVLESSYDTLGNAVRNRLAMFHTPPFIGYPFYVLFGLTVGAPPWRIRPLDYMPYATAPTLIMAGDSEPEVKVSETQALYDRCGADVKRLHFFAGAGHQNFMRRYTEEYELVLLDFLRIALEESERQAPDE